MKRKLILLALATLFVLAPLTAQAKEMVSGLGVIMGDTTGVSFKCYVNRHIAFDMAAGLASGYAVFPGISTHGDLVWTDEMVKVPEGALLFYFGGGAFWAQDSFANAETGVRALTGAEYFFHKSRWAAFAELSPTVIMMHDAGFSLHGAVGARYYFDK
jgi:hypothetical protein